MSVLKKMIGRARAQTLDHRGVVRAWSHLQTDLLLGLEAAVPQLRWRIVDVTSEPLSYKAVEATRPEAGLFFGFGYTEKTTSVLVYAHDAFAQLMSQAAFGASSPAPVFHFDEALEVSRFDVLLFHDIMQNFYRQLHETLIPQDQNGLPPTLKHLGEGVTPLPFELDDAHSDWVKICLNFKAEPRPHEGPEPGDKASKTQAEKKDDVLETAKDAAAQTLPPQANWPDRLPVTLFLPQAHYKNSLMNRFVLAAREEPLSVEDGAQNWKMRIENSRTPLRAVVENTQMTVADCTRLEIGQIIPLPGVSLQSVSLEAELANSRVKVATGALGIHKTRRAIKIKDGVDPAFIYGADMLSPASSS